MDAEDHQPPTLTTPIIDAAAAMALDDWLVAEGLAGTPEGELLEGFCSRLEALGFHVWRASIASALLHPTLEARGFILKRGEPVEQENYSRFKTAVVEEWEVSPFKHLLDSGQPSLRRHFAEEFNPGEFQLLDRFQQQGATDYIAFKTSFGPNATLGELQGLLSSWTTDRPGGYGEPEIAFLERATRNFAYAYKAISTVGTGRTLLATYLGKDAAKRVLKGEITRGQAQTIRSVIWYSDLSDFTRIADTVERDVLLQLLNDYAAAVVGIVHQHDGHVLKFMGDGILAIFQFEDGAEEEACARALDAALAAQDAVGAVSEQRRVKGLPVTGFYLSLHLGELLYGNIGGPSRLDFTVLGPAVNEASRIEALCRQLDQAIIISSAFTTAAGKHRNKLVSLGRYALKGVSRAQELFTIDRDSMAAAVADEPGELDPDPAGE